VKGVADPRSITHWPEESNPIAEREPEEVLEDLLDRPSGLSSC
jgi:hypothetical protein